MDDSLIKLYEYRASKLQSSVPSRQSSNTSESQCSINVDLLLAPPQLSTKGRPSNKRLGSELDKSIRNATRRRKKNSTLIGNLVFYVDMHFNHFPIFRACHLTKQAFDEAISELDTLNEDSHKDSTCKPFKTAHK
ncbi:hypothetical protein PIB30_059286 [Stylosanthes scabra]|uniref:Uncharacterized protein n=1 Tax=Stylosanthes scabra TaxID=79078 RepID=A0ABU6SKI8_9FABA|nr:hypothetical protein [Stylosanthes scabra]